MCDSPVNFMILSQSPAFLQSLQHQNRLLNKQFNYLLNILTSKKQQNLKYLKQIQNHQEQIQQLEREISMQEKKISAEKQIICSKQNTQVSYQNSQREYMGIKRPSKSMEIPNKKAYLDAKNKSIQSLLDSTDQDKPINNDSKSKIKQSASKAYNLYGNLYSKKSFSLKRFKVK